MGDDVFIIEVSFLLFVKEEDIRIKNICFCVKYISIDTNVLFDCEVARFPYTKICEN